MTNKQISDFGVKVLINIIAISKTVKYAHFLCSIVCYYILLGNW